jgi:hypothetical protein
VPRWFEACILLHLRASLKVSGLLFVVSMAVYLLRLGCCLTATNPPDTGQDFGRLKHQFQWQLLFFNQRAATEFWCKGWTEFNGVG